MFNVAPDGSLSGERLFASEIRSSSQNGGPDGMKCDERGNVWVTGPGGVWVYAPSGELIGKLHIPEVVANLAWGGPELRTLFVTATHSVYRLTTKVGPRIEPYMRAHAAAKDAPAPAGTGARSRPAPRRPDHSGHAERRGERGRRFRRIRSAGPCESAERRRKHSPGRSGGSRSWRSRHSCLVRCRAGRAGVTLNAPLFKGLAEHKAVVRGTWGAAPVEGLEPDLGDFVVEKMRMSAWEGTRLETILKALHRDTIINTGAWTNMSIEHTARTGADKGYVVITPEDCCATMNADWHKASIDYAMQNVAEVTKADAVIAALKGR